MADPKKEKRLSKQKPKDPVEADSFIYDLEVDEPEPPEHITALPDHPVKGFYGGVINAEKYLGTIFSWALFILGLALGILMFTQVLLRYVFKSPFVGIEEIGILLGVWFYFVGMAYVTRNGEHIHGGIVNLVVSNPNTIRKIRAVMSFICIVVTVVFAYYAIKYAFFEIEKGRLSSYMRWPKGLWSASLIVGFAGMLIYFIMQFINQIADISSQSTPSDTNETQGR